MSLTTILGALAAAVSTASFAPQAWKIIRSRGTKEISAGMYMLTVFGFALWIGFGIELGQWPLNSAAELGRAHSRGNADFNRIQIVLAGQPR